MAGKLKVWLRSGLAVSIVGSLGWTTVAVGQTVADQPRDIGTVQATGAVSGGAAVAVPKTAREVAPSRPSLDQVEPTSVVGAETLRKVIVPSQNYNDVVRLTPSAMDIAPVGPGLQQDFGQSIRGLQYTQFSVLYDGIPIPGFPFNFAPQPGIYFTSQNLGSVTIHRGPGQASAIGAATFGGYVDLASPMVANTMGATAYGTVGSYATRMGGVRLDSGLLPALGGGRATINVEQLEAGGATSNTSTARRNGFFKYEQPVGSNTVVTALVNLDHSYTKTPYGATLANIDALGRNYALNKDPTSQSFSGYNHDNYKTDFEYLGIRSDLGNGLTIDNKVYTTAYYQNSYHGADVGGLGPNLSGLFYLRGIAPADLSGDVPSFASKYFFRNTGDVLRISQDTPFGQARFGLWAEHELFTTNTFAADATRGFVPYTTAPGSIFVNRYRSNLDTLQPYAEFAWKVTPAVTVTAGLKYSLVTRTVKGEAGLTGLPQDARQSYSTPLPSVDLNWKLTDWATVFAQAARGYQTPNLNLFTTTQLTSVKPSTTNSFQVGGVIERPNYSLGTDLYYIQYENFVNSRTVGGFTTFFNQGGANYRGVEVEGTVKLPRGLAVYANASLNSSSYSTNGNVLAQTPRYTGVLGPIYDQGNIFRDGDNVFASALTKFVGPQYGLDTSAVGQSNSVPIKSYHQVDLAGGYTFPFNGRTLQLKANLYNLLNDRSIIGLAGQTVGPPSETLFFTNSGRSFFFSLEAKI
ncbi:MAG: hypothetical protein NVS2B11_08080 [Acetobacteraceae bacterium]